MNSSSNEVKKLEPEVVIEYEPEPDDYNYVPPEVPIDEEELKQLNYTGQGSDNKQVIKVVAIIVVVAIVGAIIGLIFGNISESNNDEKRKSTIASTIKRSVDNKVANFNKFATEFDKLSGAESYNKSLFDSVMSNFQSFDFLLDMSSEVSSEVILLNGNPLANPVKALREYSANTMLLTQLLSIHLNETRIDEEEIQMLIEKKGVSEVTYAMQINSDGIYYLGSAAPRDQFANGVVSIFTYRNVVKDNQELSDMYSAYKSEKGWSTAQRQYRDYVPTKAESKSLAEFDLPNRVMYEVTDRRGNDNQLFADEVLLVDRKLLFGKAANALDRYNQRTDQIKRLVEDTRKVSANISSDLSVFIKDKDAE